MLKQCSKCKKHKRVETGFYPSQGAWCRECHKQRFRERSVDPRYRRLYRMYSWRRSLKFLYGITPEVYKEIHARQQGRCGICGKTRANSRGHRLNVDHDAVTKRIRGLLCGNCNNGIGRFQHDQSLLRKAIEYLSQAG